MAVQIHFLLMFSRQGKVRLQKWYNPISQVRARDTPGMPAADVAHRLE